MGEAGRGPLEILSFRHVLVDALHAFLDGEGLDFDDAAEGLGEVLVALSGYREEGAPLYPAVFLSDDLETLLSRLGGRDHLAIGTGPRTSGTMRRALKQAAPLGQAGWSVYLVRGDDRIEYGVFRTDSFVLCPTPMARLRELAEDDVRIVGVVQLAENVLELRGSSGGRRMIYLSGAPTDALPAIALIRDLTKMATSDVASELLPKLKIFFQRVFIDAMRQPHGSLIVVVPKETSPAEVFSDCIVLERPIRVAELVAAYERTRSETARESVEGAGRLLAGMLAVDGITVLASDGSVVGFNAFLQFAPSTGGTLGGARRRTFEALSSMVGRELLGAFVRSQDGLADCRVVTPSVPSIPVGARARGRR